MKIRSKTFHFVWLLLSTLLSLFIVSQLSLQTIELPTNTFSNQGINETCKKDPKDPNRCVVSTPSSEAINVSNISKQLESFDNFFPLSAIAKFNLKIFSNLSSNAFLEIGEKPRISKKIQDIKIFCGDESMPRFDSETPKTEFPNAKPSSVNAMIYNYFFCERPSIKLTYTNEEKIEVGPNEIVKVVTQGDKIVIAQSRSILLELDTITKTIIFFIVFFLGLAAGAILYSYLTKLDLIQDSEKGNLIIKTKMYPKFLKLELWIWWSLIVVLLTFVVWYVSKEIQSAILAGTAVLIARYSWETFRLRQEMARQNDLQEMPILNVYLAGVFLRLKNVSHCSAFDIHIESIYFLENKLIFFRNNERNCILEPGDEFNIDAKTDIGNLKTIFGGLSPLRDYLLNEALQKG